ncbi:MAG: sulfotransferase [Anaerolineae bacterium]|nr:sulfotransferase [Anaerolineae bacterium]
MNPETITIVSGLPRSGTSMMMRVLEAGGMQLLTDRVRKADPDNPRGYYEFEPVKRIKRDTSWLKDAQGRAVKMVSVLLKHLPPDYQYRLVFMRREMEEILASQRQMLVRRGEPTDRIGDEQMADLFHKHLQQIETWLAEQPNIEVLYVSYNEIVEQPAEQLRRVNQFLGGALDLERMVKVVEPKLYRQRR